MPELLLCRLVLTFLVLALSAAIAETLWWRYGMGGA
jgi:hypothetical protein